MHPLKYGTVTRTFAPPPSRARLPTRTWSQIMRRRTWGALRPRPRWHLRSISVMRTCGALINKGALIESLPSLSALSARLSAPTCLTCSWVTSSWVTSLAARAPTPTSETSDKSVPPRQLSIARALPCALPCATVSISIPLRTWSHVPQRQDVRVARGRAPHGTVMVSCMTRQEESGITGQVPCKEGKGPRGQRAHASNSCPLS
jgi:hypothetical protein